MPEEKKITDAFGAEAAVRWALDTQYRDNIGDLIFSKVWYSSVGSRDFWDVEVILIFKKGKVRHKSLKYQVDPETGKIMGYEEIRRR